MKKVRITAVSYLNTKPLLYGLLQSELADKIELTLNIPSACAQKLLHEEADLALVPVAILPELKTPHIVSDFCIGSEGAVATVCLFSHCPIEEVDTIYLDYHSRTSVELTKILLKNHWKISPQLISAKPGFESKVKGKTAALIIGDRAMGLDQTYPYCYDLGQAWTDYCSLPFVFALWVSNKPLDNYFIKAFNSALKSGIEGIPQLAFLIPSPNPDFDLPNYFANHISYHFGSEKKKALTRFLKEMNHVLQPTLIESLQIV